MYYSIYFGVTGEEADFYKREFSRRISHREKIQSEIEDCLREVMPADNNSRFTGVMNLLMPALSSLDYKVHDIFYKIDLDKCQSFEIKNIEMYYEFLYSGIIREEITDMLLDQKSVVENSIFSTI